MIRSFFILVFSFLLSAGAFAEKVDDIQVRGHSKVEPDAIIAMLSSKRGEDFSAQKVKDDIKILFDLGYFSNVRVFKKPGTAGGSILIYEVTEKPAIIEISFEGMNELKEDDLKEKLETKLYTIVNEAKLSADLRIIEKQYIEKGFYLARATYNLEPKGTNEVHLKYVVEEGGKVQVADVKILGNQYFTETDLVNRMAARPYTRSSAYGSSSIFQDDFIKNDLNYLSYYYRDNGFAEVKVGKPNELLDEDKEFVRITYKVEEGLQYNIGTLDVSGDLLFTKEELLEAMKLKPGALYRISYINKDIEMLMDKYGDLGYAYADVNPIVTYDRDKRLISINYEITKGDKVYFSEMQILGNSKTRDNVVRREFEIADSELYSGTGLNKTKKNINRLGYFEDVQALKERDHDDPTLLDMKFKVKEKPTGQLQAAIGYTPQQRGNSAGFFGQGRYEEQNQFGRGYRNSLTGKWSNEKTYSLELTFTNPRVYDSQWQAGGSLIGSSLEDEPIPEVKTIELKYGATVFVGRKIIEEVVARVTYEWMRTQQRTNAYLIDRFSSRGLASSAIFSLNRNVVDNYISPTEGSEITLSQRVTGGPVLKGDFQYMISAMNAAYYLPIDFSDTFRTNFKFSLNMAYIYPYGNQPVPFYQRFRLGGFDDLRGFEFNEIGPTFNILTSPMSSLGQPTNKGGDKKLVLQTEYFIPLIQEAGIKGLIFFDQGQVFDDNERIGFQKGFAKDVGFGFRWVTPIAPFRFEFAYPILEGGRLGEMHPIFSLGY